MTLCWDPYGTAWPQSLSVPQPEQVLQCLEPSELLRGPRQAPRAPGHTQPCRGGEAKWGGRTPGAEQASGGAGQVRSNESSSDRA